MKKNVLVVIAILVVFAAMIGWGMLRDRAHDRQYTKPLVKIGAILPMTGETAKLGIAGRNGAQMAVDEINRNPDNKYTYRLIAEDCGFDTKRAVLAYKKMISWDKIQALVSFNSNVGHALRPLVVQDKVLHISSAADNTLPDGEYNFLNSGETARACQKMSDYFVRQGYKTIALVGFHHTATEEIMSNLKPVLEKDGLTIASETLFNPDERRFNIPAYKIKEKNPDAVFLYAIDPMITLFIKDLRQAGYRGEVANIYTFSFAKNREVLEGMHYVDWSYGTDSFAARYRERFQAAPESGVSMMYDSIYLIYHLYEAYGGPLTDIFPKLKAILATYEGANGPLTLSGKGVIFSEPVLRRIVGGRLEHIKAY